MQLKGSDTEENLRRAFEAEAQSACRYALYAQVAREAGQEHTGALLSRIAKQETEHARLWLSALGDIGDLAACLHAARQAEHCEWTDRYERAAAKAQEEGFSHLCFLFGAIGAIEKAQEDTVGALLSDMETCRVFSRGEMTLWQCRRCAYLAMAPDAPDGCPVCGAPRGFFEVREKEP